MEDATIEGADHTNSNVQAFPSCVLDAQVDSVLKIRVGGGGLPNKTG